ncbi:MAG: glycogen synthase GlgA [Acidobacteria bacterium]|nr:glycogen synthase GlgA [Acidobacteriota bacterium]
MSVSVLMVGSEALPFSKTGGLADVLGALPVALGRLGHRVTLVTPKYRGVQARGSTKTILVPGLGGPISETRIIEQQLAENVKVVLVDRPELYDRESIYGAGGDYPDNPRRFGFLCRAALEYALQAAETFDVLHGHDWQAGLAAVYLRTRYAAEPRLRGMASVFTIHNLAYQGTFPPDWLAPLELGPELMSIDTLEFWEQMSFLKGGIVFSDLITTVSPTYAKEIQTKEYGAGFEGVLTARAKDLCGILNGIDTDRWDPRRDPFLPEPFDENSLEGKDAARRALVELIGPEMSFDRLPRPLVGIVSRLVDQKGFDLVAELAGILPEYGSFAVLGTGDPRYEELWRDLAMAHPDRFAVQIGFNESLAHLIEGAADLFLMPSRFEPCGLNQMYSMRYGTVPVVRATGGLVDTVRDYNVAAGGGTGFTFEAYTADALLEAMERARTAFANPKIWHTLQREGMRQDFSWDRSAREYVKLYENALAGPRAYIGSLQR